MMQRNADDWTFFRSLIRQITIQDSQNCLMRHDQDWFRLPHQFSDHRFKSMDDILIGFSSRVSIMQFMLLFTRIRIVHVLGLLIVPYDAGIHPAFSQPPLHMSCHHIFLRQFRPTASTLQLIYRVPLFA